MSFQLLLLPHRAFDQTMKFMNLMEIVLLSLCSKKAAGPIRRFQNESIRIQVDFQKNEIIVNEDYIYNVNEKNIGRFFSGVYTLKTADGRLIVPFTLNSDNQKMLTSFVEDKFLWSRMFLAFLMKNFKCVIVRCITPNMIFDDKYENLCRSLIGSQVEIQNLELHCSKIPNNYLIWLLDNLKYVRSIYIYLQPNRYFIYNFKINAQYIEVKNSSWIDFTTIITMTKFSVIILENSILANRDVGLIVKAWQTGEFPNLEYMSISGERISWKNPINNVHLHLLSVGKRALQKKRIKGIEYSIRGGMEVKRKDGVIATVQNLSSFQLLIWN